jgi:uncharacterized membrane protein
MLNAPHLHLLLNHFPLFATLFGLASLAYGMARKSAHFRVAGYFLLIAGALATVPVYLSGSQSEDVVENLSGVAKSLIDAHEDAATISLAAVLIAGILAAFSWYVDGQKTKLSAAASAITLALALVALGSFGYTALLGGQIHHPEIRPNSTTLQDGQN